LGAAFDLYGIYVDSHHTLLRSTKMLKNKTGAELIFYNNSILQKFKYKFYNNTAAPAYNPLQKQRIFSLKFLSKETRYDALKK